MTTPEQLADEITANTHGITEWRVQDPADGSYCISFGSESFTPERDAREWLADHIKRHPASQFAGYEVAKVHYFTKAERRALDAAALLRQQAEQLDAELCNREVLDKMLTQCIAERDRLLKTVADDTTLVFDLCAERDKLRDALAGMIGASTKEELDAMELGVRSIPGCEEDRAVALNAIHALRACAV